VFTNDKRTPTSTIAISGQVEKFVTIRPKYIKLFGHVGEEIKATVTIIPEEKYPFKIMGVRANRGHNILYTLAERDPAEGKGYLLTIRNRKPDMGSYSDVIVLQTDNNIQPEIKITLYGRLLAQAAPKPQKTQNN
jgi:hypothetical protein